MSDTFKCKKCGKEVTMRALGTHNRNHCPYCLWSLHVDNLIGDRQSDCNALMKPIGLVTKKDGEIMLVHLCEKCGKISTNRIAGDDDIKRIKKVFKNQDTQKIIGLKLVPFIDGNELKLQLHGKKF